MKTAVSGDNMPGGTQNAEVGFRSMKIFLCAIVALLTCTGFAAMADPFKPTAVFGIGLDDTSLQGQEQGRRDDEQARLAALDRQLRDALAQSGCCAVIDLPAAARDTDSVGLPSCDGCEVEVARQMHADIAVTGWVQKVSNLILNINIIVRDVSTGKIISAASVDIRGNTNESWTRGLSYLLRNKLHPSEW